MEQEQLFIDYIERSIVQNWDKNALTDYQGITLQYKDVARKIAKFHIVLESAGIRPGDKIAVCGRNSAHWAVCFLATVTYGAVIVPILHEFKADNIHNIVNHSEAKLLFVGDRAWENLNEEAMPLLMGVVLLTEFYSRSFAGTNDSWKHSNTVMLSMAHAIPKTSVPNISAIARNSLLKNWRSSITLPAPPAIPKA